MIEKGKYYNILEFGGRSIIFYRYSERDNNFLFRIAGKLRVVNLVIDISYGRVTYLLSIYKRQKARIL